MSNRVRQQDIDFEKMFKIMLNPMRLNRSHPNVSRNLKWVCQFGTMHGIFFFVYCLLIYSTVFHDLKRNDFSQACANGILSIIFNIVSLQYTAMVWHQNEFRTMMTNVKNDYAVAKTLARDDYNVVLLYAKKGRRIVYMWLKIVVCVGSLFPIKSITLMLYYKIKGNFKLVPLYDITYPQVVDEKKDDLPVFFALYALFSFYDVYASSTMLGFAPLGPLLILHVCGQLELVRMRILNIFTKNSDRNNIIDDLKGIAKHLQYIYDFMNHLHISLQTFHEILFKAVAIILPISFYQIIETAKKGEISFEFISILFGSVAICGIPCYYSNILLEKSEGVRMALYTCGWENYWDRDIRILIRMLLTRTLRPVVMRTLFREISLTALTDISQQGYAIFNVLNAMWR